MNQENNEQSTGTIDAEFSLDKARNSKETLTRLINYLMQQKGRLLQEPPKKGLPQEHRKQRLQQEQQKRIQPAQRRERLPEAPGHLPVPEPQRERREAARQGKLLKAAYPERKFE